MTSSYQLQANAGQTVALPFTALPVVPTGGGDALTEVNWGDIGGTLSDQADLQAYLAPFTVTSNAVVINRAIGLGTFDHTIAAGATGAPPAGRIFISTIDGLVYHRLADGSTRRLDNEYGDYSGNGTTFDAGIGVWSTSPPGTQPAAIADVPTAGSATAAGNAAAINSILSALRLYGFIDT